MDNKLKYGLFIGVFFFIALLTEYYMHIAKGPYYAIMWFVPAFFILVFMAINGKRKQNGGEITLGDAFRTGLGSAVIGTIISSLAVYIYYKFIDHDSIKLFAENFRKRLVEANTDPDKITEQMDNLTSNFPSQASIVTLALMLFVGGLVSLVIAVVMSRKKA